MQLLNVHRIRFNPKYCVSDSAISWRRSQHVEATSQPEVSTFYELIKHFAEITATTLFDCPFNLQRQSNTVDRLTLFVY